MDQEQLQQNGKIGKINIYRDIILTSLIWTVLMLLVGWVLAAIGWYFLALLWRRELFVPYNVKVTAIAAVIITLWGVVTFLLSFIWAKFNYHRYYRKNRRQLEVPMFQAPRISWAAATLAPSPPTLTVTDRSQTIPITKQEVPVEVASSLVGRILRDNIYNADGQIVALKGTLVTPELIDILITSGLYEELLIAMEGERKD